MTKPTLVSRIVLGIVLSAFLFAACNNEKKEKKEGDKMDQKMESTVDTGSTKPVSPGN